jgi:TrmH family RNA methyltransferase
MTEMLTSPHNERVKAVVALHRSKGRRASGSFLVEGQHPVAEALADGWVTEIFCLAHLEDRFAGDVPVTLVDDRVLRAMSDAKTPQGVVGVACVRTSTLSEVVGAGLLVVLSAASDPGNAGTIIRTADAVGAAGVVFTHGSVDPFSPKVARSTAGSITHVPLVLDVDLAEVIAACRASGQRTVGLEAACEVQITAPGMFAGAVALVMGSEAHGLPPEIRSDLDALASVPVYGRSESLNLAVATAVTLYEAARQQRT